jgi:penicillin-binding protein 1C
VAVWVGNFSGERTMEVSGSFGAGRIFHSTIRYLNEKEKNITNAYPSLIQRTVCRKSGLLAGKTCPQVTIRIRKQNSQTKECNEHNLTPNEKPRLIAPIDGQVFMVQPHLALDRQFVPIKVKNRNKKELVQIRLGKASYFNLDANGMTRIPFTLGKHELTLLSGTSEFQKIQISIK